VKRLTEEQQQLVEEHMPLAKWFAAGFQGTKLSRDERIAAAYWAICRAARSWDPAGKASFWTYSQMIIRQDIYADQRMNTLTARWKVGLKVVSGDVEIPDVVSRSSTCRVDARDELDHWRDRLKSLLPRLETQAGNQQAEVVRLRMQGLSFTEIGAARGVVTQSGRDLFKRAVERLRRLA
jgi:RNA polymerase sigma factor (sigma-70 family)